MSSPNRSLVIADRARRDFEEILYYSIQTWGQRQADLYEAAIDHALRQLLAFPFQGRARDDLFTGCRSRLVEHHLIFYEVTDTEINVVRILHQRADPARHVLR
jgi:toxin ParE1/3/4